MMMPEHPIVEPCAPSARGSAAPPRAFSLRATFARRDREEAS
jgi:hypothetical protein